MGELARDPRCAEMYLSWARPIRETYIQQRRQHPTLNSGAVFSAALYQNVSADLGSLRNFITSDLQLPYEWLASVFLHVFQTRLIEEATGADMNLLFQKPPTDARRKPGEKHRDFIRRLTQLDAPPPGRRRVKNEGTHLARDVAWFYRARIKHTPDTVYAIAKEYAVAAKRHNSAVSVIQTGIRRARQILDGVTIAPRWPPRPTISDSDIPK